MMNLAPHHPARKHGESHCAACGDLLVGRYFILVESNDRFCANCMETKPRCDSCGAPVGPQHWRLHDGRLQCDRCHTTAIYDPADARRIYDETVAGVVTQLGLKLRVGVEFRLVDAPTLTRLRTEGDVHADPEERTLGLYRRQGRLRAIYLLHGLPRLPFRTTVAHEYAHAWQGEHCPLLEDHTLREGFAEWVAYRHLLWLGCTRAAERMLRSQHPYRPLMEYVLGLEQQLGIGQLLEYMRRAE